VELASSDVENKAEREVLACEWLVTGVQYITPPLARYFFSRLGHDWAICIVHILPARIKYRQYNGGYTVVLISPYPDQEGNKLRLSKV